MSRKEKVIRQFSALLKKLCIVKLEIILYNYIELFNMGIVLELRMKYSRF